jgi:AGZA family xanthine/uracil permease-like MFS transporter
MHGWSFFVTSEHHFLTCVSLCKPYAESLSMTKNRYQWAQPGDINAFFGLMLDNIAGMVLMVSLLFFNFGFPVDFALSYMIPGTAIGVLVGDLMFFWLAFRLAKRENRSDVTAMPLGLDTPSTLGMVFFVIGPAFISKASELAAAAGFEDIASLRTAFENNATLATQLSEVHFNAAMHAWHVGLIGILLTGVFKIICAFGSNWIRSVFPRAGLLGSLAAIALVLIAFIPLSNMTPNPIVGFASLVVVFITLIGRNKLPFKIPGALGAVVIGCLVWYLMLGIDKAGYDIVGDQHAAFNPVWWPQEWLTAFSFGWVSAFGDALTYLPYLIPFAIATVIGGIDCAESAASAGDDFNTGTVIGIEGIATLVAGLCGGVIQTTPYIGHPAYKAMGGRAAYILATALFVGSAGLIGYFSLILQWLPEAAVFPILIFIGIEITAQSFQVTPKRHYCALAVACLPALAKLVMIFLGQFVATIDYSQVGAGDAARLQGIWLNLSVLAGGFIITSLLWASAMAMIVDRKFNVASVCFAIGGILVLFGIIHSPLPGDQMFWPWDLGNEEMISADQKSLVIQFAIAYFVMGLVTFGMSVWTNGKVNVITTDEEFEALGE